MSFMVKLEPEVLARSALNEPLDFRNIDLISIRRKIDAKFEIIYNVDDLWFGYYPSHTINVLGDLNSEWLSAIHRESHVMSLSGYPVLEVVYHGEYATFFCSWETDSGRYAVGTSPANHVEREFAAATSALWDYVQRTLKLGVT